MFGDFQQALPLRIVEIAGKFDFPIDPVEIAELCFTVAAIFRVYPRMLEANDDAAEIPALALRVESKRHGCTGSEARHQKLVWSRSTVFTEWRRLIRNPVMLAGSNGLA